MRKKIIIGNWKMNKTVQEVQGFFDEFNENKINVRSNMIYGIAAPFVNIVVAQDLKQEPFIIASQDVSQHEKGAFTGEVSASMLASIGVKYTIVGHSERRQYHNETNEIVNLKAKKAIEHGIIPIICVGETLTEYESNKSKEVVEKQIKESLRDLDMTNIVIAYEPVWAIGTGKTATVEYAQEICSFIRTLTSNETLIQYGGSVTAENIDNLLEQNDIDGALVGGASLDVNSFIKLISK